MKAVSIFFTISLVFSILFGGYLAYRYIYIPQQYLEEMEELYAIRNRTAVQNLFKKGHRPIPPYSFHPIRLLEEPSEPINYAKVKTPKAYYEHYKKLKSLQEIQVLEKEIQSELDRSLAFEKNLFLFCLQHEDYLILNQNLCDEIETSYKQHSEGHQIQKSLLTSEESDLKNYHEIQLNSLLFYEAKSYLPEFYQKQTKYQDFLANKLSYRKDLCRNWKKFITFYTTETKDSSILHYAKKYY